MCIFIRERGAAHQPVIGIERDFQSMLEKSAHGMRRIIRGRARLHVAREAGLDGDSAFTDFVHQPQILGETRAMADSLRATHMHCLAN